MGDSGGPISCQNLGSVKKTKSNGGTSFSRYIILPRTQLYLFLAGDLSAMVPIVPINPFFTSQAMSENQRPAGAVLHSASSRVSVTWPGSDFRCSWWMGMKLLPSDCHGFVRATRGTICRKFDHDRSLFSRFSWNHGNWIRGIIPIAGRIFQVSELL